MNGCCETFCYDSDETRSENDLLQSSTLSIPVPVENRFCGKDPFATNYLEDGDMMDADLDATPYDEEQEALTEALRKMDIREQHSADQRVTGTAETTKMFAKIDEVQAEQNILNQKFIELEQTIKRLETNLGHAISEDEFEAYRIAREMNPEYVKHPLFTIGFLRAEDYDIEKTARRIFEYLRTKLDLFGREKLTRDILLDDLGEDGRAYLESGALQVLPKRDSSGRRVIFGFGRLNGKGTQRQVLGAKKAYFYFWTSVSESDTERGKIMGIVGIMWRVHKPPMPEKQTATALFNIWNSSPIKFSCYHMAYGPMTFDGFAKFNLAWFKNRNLMQYRRAHFDPAMHILYTMKTKYGIPSEYLPLNHATLGETCSEAKAPLFQMYNHDIWVQHRIALDKDKRTLYDSVASSTGSVDVIWMNSQLETGSANVDELLNLLRTSGVSIRSSTVEMLMDMSFSSLNESLELSNEEDDILIGGPIESFSGLVPVDDDKSLSRVLDEALIASRTLAPAEKDIKFGRGKPLQKHPGNIWFRTLISDQFEVYDNADKRKQTELSRHIIAVIKNEGRKFWKEQDGHWEIVGDEDAREKVAITFRTERKKRRARGR